MSHPRPEHKRLNRHDSESPAFLAWEGKELKFVVLLTAWFATAGCNSPASHPSFVEMERVRPNRIVAQGQILPANGLIRLAATPGDAVEEVLVKVGDRVVAGQPLVVMRSLRVGNSQLESLNRRFEDAQQQKDAAIERAKLGVASAELKIKQAAAQFNSLGRHESILDLAKEQVRASEGILRRLESIAQEPLTKDFISTIELDRQRLAVSEAELKLRQQMEAFTQTEETVEWSQAAAKQELAAAQATLNLAENSAALAAIESDRKTLQLNIEASTIRAPRDAVVVAVNTRVGESAAQYPLIELAETDEVICAVEVVEADASLIAPGQTATISSPALPRELHGIVLRRDHLVGRPQLPSADPLAKADYRTANVIVELLAEDASIASEWLQLQVKAEIDVEATEPAIPVGATDTSAP